jgi:hypothetical protein
MAISVEISCINKPDRTSRREAIQNVGGVNADGSRWRMSEKDAIAGIEGGQYAFWTKGGGQKTDVIIAVSAAGNKYLKTRADTTTKDNLLSLPECPR